MVKKALFVGINYYATPSSKLRGCIDDIINMRNMLIDAYGYDLSDITLLRDDTVNAELMPTKRNILNALNVLVANSENNTEFWFHYSGHGALLKKDSIIVPSDYLVAGTIPDHELYDIFKNAKCRCFLLFDSCNSGNIVELPWKYEYKSPTQIVKTNVNNRILENTEMYSFAGCKSNQTCGDIYSVDEAEYVGVFTEAFLICLRRNKHEVDLLKLYTDICIYLDEKKRIQIPIFASSIVDPSYSLVREGSCRTKMVNLSKMLFY
jgi:hypothetical protein